MIKYTTGEVAKLCNITVRTVQYYDNIGVFTPSIKLDGGRRLYTDEDLKKLKLICYLRSLDMSIEDISRVFRSPDGKENLSKKFAELKCGMKKDISDTKDKLKKLTTMQYELKLIKSFSVDAMDNVMYRVDTRKELSKLRLFLLIVGVVMSAIECMGLVYAILTSRWLPFVLGMIVAIGLGLLVCIYYISQTKYICTSCNKSFNGKFLDVFVANHTPNTRKLRCPHCNHVGYAIEVYRSKEGEKDAKYNKSN